MPESSRDGRPEGFVPVRTYAEVTNAAEVIGAVSDGFEVYFEGRPVPPDTMRDLTIFVAPENLEQARATLARFDGRPPRAPAWRLVLVAVVVLWACVALWRWWGNR